MLFPDALHESPAALGAALPILTDIRKVSALLTDIRTDEHVVFSERQWCSRSASRYCGLSQNKQVKQTLDPPQNKKNARLKICPSRLSFPLPAQ
jgi:hypothetical protein